VPKKISKILFTSRNVAKFRWTRAEVCGILRRVRQEQRQKLGQLVRQRRDELGLSKDRAAAEAGVSPVTWTRVEDGAKVRILTYAGVERVLGWRPGACESYLRRNDLPTLDGEYHDDPIISEIMATELSERHKAMVIDRYQQLRAEHQRLWEEQVRAMIRVAGQRD